MKESISSIIEIENYSINQDRKFFSATHEEIEKGLTTDYGRGCHNWWSRRSKLMLLEQVVI